MPTYVYKCDSCGHEMEEKQSIHDDALTTCPSCGKEHLKRIVQPAGGFRIQGRGVQRPTSRYGS